MVHDTPVDHLSIRAHEIVDGGPYKRWYLKHPPERCEDKWPHHPLPYVTAQIHKIVSRDCLVDVVDLGVYVIALPVTSPDVVKLKVFCEELNTIPYVNLAAERLWQCKLSPRYHEVLYLTGGETVHKISEVSGALFSRCNVDHSAVIWGTKRQLLDCKRELDTVVDMLQSEESIRPNQEW